MIVTTEITEGHREEAGEELKDNDPLTERIIGAAIDVHRALGPGLLESAYEACLAYELSKRGLRVERQKLLPIEYDGMRIDAGYRLRPVGRRPSDP